MAWRRPRISEAVEYCALCRAPATAAWHGDQSIAVCPRCALESLPALIADAIELKHVRPGGIAKLRALQMERTFWKALALRVLGERTQ